VKLYTLTVNLNVETYTAAETLTGAPDIDDNIEQRNTWRIGGKEVEITYR